MIARRTGREPFRGSYLDRSRQNGPANTPMTVRGLAPLIWRIYE